MPEDDKIKRIFLGTKTYKELETSARKLRQLDVHDLKTQRRSMRLKIKEWAIIGRISSQNPQVKAINDYVISVVNQLMAIIASQNPMFSMRAVQIGSSVEGVKTKAPDEMDFLCEFSGIAGITVAPSPAPTYKGASRNIKSYYDLRVTNGGTWKKYTRKRKRTLNAKLVKKDFFSALKNSVQVLQGDMHQQDSVQISQNGPAFTLHLKTPFLFPQEKESHKKTYLQRRFVSNGSKSSGLIVKVDLTLAVPMTPKVLPKSALAEVATKGRCKECHFIPTDDRVWKLSFAKFESLLVKRMPPEANDCLVALKVISLGISRWSVCRRGNH